MKNGFALTYTFKNEVALLRTSCLYHLAQGCKKIYLFDDGSDDGTPKSIKDLPRTVLMTSKKPTEAELQKMPVWIKQIYPFWDEKVDVRKRINTYLATQMAIKEDIEWLGCIDADEAIVTESKLSESLQKIPKDKTQILFRNIEVAPITNDVQNPFLECEYFYDRFIITEQIHRYLNFLLRKLSMSPKTLAWFEHYFYKARFLGHFSRKFIDPTDSSTIPAGYFIGYKNFKSMVRLSHSEEYAFNVHKWDSFKSKPNNIYIGNTLHYDIFNSAGFANKFRQRPQNMLIKDFYLRYRLATIARESDEDTLKQFFEDFFVIKNKNKLVQKGILRRVENVKMYLEN